MIFEFTVILHPQATGNQFGEAPPPLKNVLFFCTNLYNFNTDKTHTWKIERVLSFSAHSSLSCGDRCAIALTKLSFTCFVSFENIETVVNTKYVIL